VVTAQTCASAKGAEGEVVIGSAEEIAASAISLGQMVAVWNALPGTTSISKFKDRKTAAQRLWTAFTQLPVDAEARSRHRGARKARRRSAKSDASAEYFIQFPIRGHQANALIGLSIKATL
jgi:hypothetical protein